MSRELFLSNDRLAPADSQRCDRTVVWRLAPGPSGGWGWKRGPKSPWVSLPPAAFGPGVGRVVGFEEVNDRKQPLAIGESLAEFVPVASHRQPEPDGIEPAAAVFRLVDRLAEVVADCLIDLVEAHRLGFAFQRESEA